MIVTELEIIGNQQFKHTYSDLGYFIRKVGTDEVYEEAYDILESTYEYEETEDLIPEGSIALLHLTRGDVFRGLLQARGITRAQIRAMIEAMPYQTEEQQTARELALIDFDEALYFYRGNSLIDTLAESLGISRSQMTKFFRTNDYTALNE